jgi:Ca2+-binding EF-hand superfamily protein
VRDTLEQISFSPYVQFLRRATFIPVDRRKGFTDIAPDLLVPGTWRARSTLHECQPEPETPHQMIPMKNSNNRAALTIACTLVLSALPAAFAGNKDDKFKKMDTNGDGKVTREEHAAGARQMFTKSDANHDGVVTAAEMDAAMVAQGEKPGKYDKTSAEKIKMIDQNGDGQLTTAEHEAGSERMFAMMDKDADGFLSKAECDEGHETMKRDK